MGLSIGHGLGIPFQKSGISWQTYWSQQSEVLFFGLYSEISGGKMPNKVIGATDFLTVAGSVGSETYQCPNTAAYIAADTDYIWFECTGIINTVKNADLIGYDFNRTIVYYDDVSPYTLRAIAILKPTASVTNKMRNDFHLSAWWDNTLSAYGYIKGNRGSVQSIWHKYTKLLSDFEGENEATAFTDLVAGSYEFAGAAKISTSEKKFGSSSLDILSLGSIKLSASESFNFGSADFTIDLWFTPKSFNVSYANVLCGQCDAAATASKRQSLIQLKANDKKLIFYFWDNTASLLTSSLGSTVFAINNQYHIAVVRNGNTITGYVNGVAECTLDVTGKTLQSVTEKFVIGINGELSGAQTYARGYIDEFRITKGVARWTANFTPPTTAYIID